MQNQISKSNQFQSVIVNVDIFREFKLNFKIEWKLKFDLWDRGQEGRLQLHQKYQSVGRYLSFNVITSDM